MWGDEMKLRSQMSAQDTLYSSRVVESIREGPEGGVFSRHTHTHTHIRSHVTG